MSFRVQTQDIEGEFYTCISQELPEGELPEWIHVFPTEPFWHPVPGLVEPTPQMLESFVANFDRYVALGLVDYEHQSMADPPVEAPAAGWYDRVEVRDDGIWAHVKEWTPRMQGYLRNKEYRYLSPVFALVAKDRRTGANIGPVLLSVGAVNNPQIDGLAPLVNRLQPQHEDDMPFSPAILTLLGLAADATEDDAIEAITGLKSNPFAASVRSALELDGDADGAAACSAIEALRQPGQPGQLVVLVPEEIRAALELDADADVAAACSAVEALKASQAGVGDAVSLADHAQLQSELVTVKAEMRVRDDAVAPAARKIACQLLLANEGAYEEWLKTAPKVPAGDIKPPKGDSAAAGDVTAEELAVCKQIGVTKEQYLEAKGH